VDLQYFKYSRARFCTFHITACPQFSYKKSGCDELLDWASATASAYASEARRAKMCGTRWISFAPTTSGWTTLN